MRTPITFCALTTAEPQVLTAGLRSATSFTLRRCQILLASSRGQQAHQIAVQLSCGGQTVRNAIHDFNTRGLAAIQPRSTAPRHTPPAVFDATRREHLRELLHQSPRTFGYPTRVWTLPLVAKVAHAQGLTPRAGSGEAIRPALNQLRVGWKRAKHWITSPDPHYVRKKNSVTG